MNTDHASPELFAAMNRTGEAYWLCHKDYPGYFATLDGRVFSARLKRFMSPTRVGKYVGLQVVHSRAGLTKRYLHRLLLEFWTGYIPAGVQACHNNGVPTDNRVGNLRWDTVKNNHADKVAHGTSPTGERNAMAKLTAASVREIRTRVLEGEKQRSLCAEFGVSPMTINRAVRGESWSSIK